MSLELLMGWSVCGVSYLGSHGGQIGFLSTVFSAVLDFRWKNLASVFSFALWRCGFCGTHLGP